MINNFSIFHTGYTRERVCMKSHHTIMCNCAGTVSDALAREDLEGIGWLLHGKGE